MALVPIPSEYPLVRLFPARVVTNPKTNYKIKIKPFIMIKWWSHFPLIAPEIKETIRIPLLQLSDKYINVSDGFITTPAGAQNLALVPTPSVDPLLHVPKFTFPVPIQVEVPAKVITCPNRIKNIHKKIEDIIDTIE